MAGRKWVGVTAARLGLLTQGRVTRMVDAYLDAYRTVLRERS